MTAAARAALTWHIPTWTFADRLRKVRTDVLDLHQAEFAELLGVTKNAYAAWESGRTQPRDILGIAHRIEEESSVPAAWLLGVEGGAVTGTETRGFTTASSSPAPVLSLVPNLPPCNDSVVVSNASSFGYTEQPDVLRSAEAVKNADAA